MAAVTGCTTRGISPQLGRKMLVIITPATADSADTVDVSSATATGGETLVTVDAIVSCFDNTTGDQVTATISGTTVTIDAAGGTSNHVYSLTIVGQA